MRKLKHSYNERGGMPLETGRMWEIDRDHSLNEMYVYATPSDIRLVSIWCGEWEQAQRDASHFNPAEARALGEALIDAAEMSDRHAFQWRSNVDRVDPQPVLDRMMSERIAEDEADRQARADADRAAAEEREDAVLTQLREKLAQQFPAPSLPEKPIRKPAKRDANGRFVKSPAGTIKDLNAKFNTFLSSVATIDANAAAVDNQTCTVELVTAGDRKIGVIAVLRSVDTDLSLADARHMVDTPHYPVAIGVRLDTATALADRLRAVGATVTVLADGE